MPRFRLEGLWLRRQNRLFCAHTQCMSYVTNMFLLVRSSVRSKQVLCFVHYQGQKSTKKLKWLLLLLLLLFIIYFSFFDLVDYWTVFSGGKLCRSKNLIIQVHTILNDFFSLIMAVNISHSVIRSSIHPSVHSSIQRQESPNNSREINWLNHLHDHSSLEKIDRSSLRLGG